MLAPRPRSRSRPFPSAAGSLAPPERQARLLTSKNLAFLLSLFFFSLSFRREFLKASKDEKGLDGQKLPVLYNEEEGIQIRVTEVAAVQSETSLALGLVLVLQFGVKRSADERDGGSHDGLPGQDVPKEEHGRSDDNDPLHDVAHTVRNGVHPR